MKTWYDTKYGKAPYKDVVLVEFSIDNVADEKEVAYLQYNLLLNEEVVQAHLEFLTKKGIAIFSSGTNPEAIFKKSGIKYRIEEKEIIPYELVLESNNMFTHKK
jgi:hypothetical protein